MSSDDMYQATFGYQVNLKEGPLVKVVTELLARFPKALSKHSTPVELAATLSAVQSLSTMFLSGAPPIQTPGPTLLSSGRMTTDQTLAVPHSTSTKSASTIRPIIADISQQCAASGPSSTALSVLSQPEPRFEDNLGTETDHEDHQGAETDLEDNQGAETDLEDKQGAETGVEDNQSAETDLQDNQGAETDPVTGERGILLSNPLSPQDQLATKPSAEAISTEATVRLPRNLKHPRTSISDQNQHAFVQSEPGSSVRVQIHCKQSHLTHKNRAYRPQNVCI